MYHKGKEEYMSDNKRVLLIGDKKSFMVNAIAKGLIDEGFDVLQVLPEVNDISSNIDYEMPVADGPKVLEMLHQDGKLSMVPVMFLTGKSDKDSVLKAG